MEALMHGNEYKGLTWFLCDYGSTGRSGLSGDMENCTTFECKRCLSPTLPGLTDLG
jgi:hypothetical protein